MEESLIQRQQQRQQRQRNRRARQRQQASPAIAEDIAEDERSQAEHEGGV